MQGHSYVAKSKVSKVVAGLSPALACWRGVAAFAANFPSPRADLLALHPLDIWSEWRLTVIAATVRIALVDILDLSEVDIPAGGFLYPAVGLG